MSESVVRLVEQARERASYGVMDADTRATLAGLAHAVGGLLDELHAVRRDRDRWQDDYDEANARAHDNFDVAMKERERGDVARARVADLEAGLRKLETTVEAFGVESTRWEAGNVTGASAGLAIPDDCDRCEVTIDADVYEAMTDVLALLDSGEDRP